jgi:hypothetical protein
MDWIVYRDEGKRAREWAALTLNSLAAQAWGRIAENYERLAVGIDVADRAVAHGTSPTKPQSQPMQQQAEKKEMYAAVFPAAARKSAKFSNLKWWPVKKD